MRVIRRRYTGHSESWRRDFRMTVAAVILGFALGLLRGCVNAYGLPSVAPQGDAVTAPGDAGEDGRSRFGNLLGTFVVGGVLDDGRTTFIYLHVGDGSSDAGIVSIEGDGNNDGENAEVFSGTETRHDGIVTVTDDESGRSISFAMGVSANAGGIDVDVDGYGTGSKLVYLHLSFISNVTGIFPLGSYRVPTEGDFPWIDPVTGQPLVSSQADSPTRIEDFAIKTFVLSVVSFGSLVILICGIKEGDKIRHMAEADKAEKADEASKVDGAAEADETSEIDEAAEADETSKAERPTRSA